MCVAEYVTLGNISCNLCRNKIARQVAREIAQCNSAFKNSLKREVCRCGVGKGLQLMKGPAVAACSISVNKKASMVSGKRTAEEWLDDDGFEKVAAW